MPQELRRFVNRNAFLPVMATGDSESLSATILRALNKAQNTRQKNPTTREVITAVRDSVTKAKRKRFGGLLLVLDELG